MKTARILTLKLAKRLRHHKETCKSYVYKVRPTLSLPQRRVRTAAAAGYNCRPIIFFEPDERQRIARAALAASPRTCRATISKAARICAGEIEVFGEKVDLNGGIRWHTDYATGRTWPKIPAPRVKLVCATDKSDVKAPWELARFQFLGDLGRAWAYTGDEKYPQRAWETIESFLADNPPGIGLHWTNPMEAAIRSANWIVADSFFTGAAAWGKRFVARLRLSLYDHGRFIRTHLERDGRGINNNHYTADLAGLFILGLYLHDVDGCAAWLDFALSELDSEIDCQVAPDGMHYENSPGYHRLTFEMFFYTHRLGRLNGIGKVARWEDILTKMADFTLAVTMPTGKVPNFGDNDDGLWLGGSPRAADDHRYLVYMSIAAFDRPRPAPIEPAVDEIPEEIFWFLGVDAAQLMTERRAGPKQDSENNNTGLSKAEHSPRPARISNISSRGMSPSRVFDSSGIIIMRSGNAYVLVAANPVGTGGIGGHKHNDLLSYIFTVGDKEIVVDPGTYAYTAEPHLRNELRTTAAHNTVTVDDAEQNRFYRRQLFWVREDAHPQIVNWEPGDRIDRLVVCHDGYRRLSGRVMHTRRFVFDKAKIILAVRDELTGTKTHDLQSTINFGEGILNADDPHRVVLRLGDTDHEAGFYFDAGLPWRFSLEPAWRSVRYRRKTPIFKMVQRCRAQLPISWTTVIGVFNGPVVWELLEQAAENLFGESINAAKSSVPQTEPVFGEACR